MPYSFEWDPTKAATNVKDHGVSFDEATTVFGDLLAMNMPDPDHSEGEQRFLVLGMSEKSRLVVVSYAERPPRTGSIPDLYVRGAGQKRTISVA